MTGPALSIMARCNRLGVTVEDRNGRLWAGPADRLTVDLRDGLREHRAAILATLAMAEPVGTADPFPLAIRDADGLTHLERAVRWQREARETGVLRQGESWITEHRP